MKPTNPTAEFTAAEARINATPELEQYRDVCLYDWTEADHLAWIATAPLAEVLSWADMVQGQHPADESEL